MTDHHDVLAVSVFAVCAFYLEKTGWSRDGDDPGIWLRPGFAMPLGDALTVQLEHDGVSLLETPASPGWGYGAVSGERVIWLTLTEGTSIAVPMREALAMTEREFAQLYRKHLYGVSRSAAREWAREQVRPRAAATAAGGGTDG